MFASDYSLYDKDLFAAGLSRVQESGLLLFDDATGLFRENPDPSAVYAAMRKSGQIWEKWISFAVGVEALLKATLLHHQVQILARNNDLREGLGTAAGGSPLRSGNTQAVYRNLLMFSAKADPVSFMGQEFARTGVGSSWEINLGTMGSCRKRLQDLLAKGKVDAKELEVLDEGLRVLALARRNVDAHLFLKVRVIGSINGDLEKVYLPVINLLLAIYRRP